MQITVRQRSDGASIQIDESAFDAQLHERVEQQRRTVGDMSPEEFGGIIASAFTTSAREALTQLGVTQPRREQLATPAVPYGSALRARPAWENQYRTLPAWEREVRTPESDVEVWRFLRGIAHRDHAAVREVLARDPAFKDPVLARALAEDTAAAGGALVPSPLANIIVAKRDKRERIAPRAMRLMTDADTLTVPAEATVGAVGGVAENAAIGETDSTFAEVTLRKKKAGRLVRSSRELLEDVSGAFSLVTILSNQASRKLAVYMDTQAATGNGTGTQHTDGLANNGSIGAITGTSGALTRAKVITLYNGLPSEWREGGGAVWMANSNVIGFLARLTDASDRPIYDLQNAAARPVADTLGTNVVNMVEGLPLIEVPFSTDILMLGLLEEGFGVLLDSGIRVEATTEGESAFSQDQVVWKFVERRDSAVLIADAFKKSDGAILAPA